MNLHNISQSSAFYESRYASGYENNLTSEKKKRIYEIIRQLRLPLSGDALDFGCGNISRFEDVISFDASLGEGVAAVDYEFCIFGDGGVVVIAVIG